MEVHGDDMVAARHDKHVGDELGCDRGSGLVLLVHASVRETGNDGGDTTSGGGLAGGDEDEELHEVVIDVVAPRLDDEDVLVADGLGYLDVDLAI